MSKSGPVLTARKTSLQLGFDSQTVYLVASYYKSYTIPAATLGSNRSKVTGSITIWIVTLRMNVT